MSIFLPLKLTLLWTKTYQNIQRILTDTIDSSLKRILWISSKSKKKHNSKKMSIYCLFFDGLVCFTGLYIFQTNSQSKTSQTKSKLSQTEVSFVKFEEKTVVSSADGPTWTSLTCDGKLLQWRSFSFSVKLGFMNPPVWSFPRQNPATGRQQIHKKD